MTIEFNGDIHEFSFNTAYFTVTPQEFYFIGESEKDAQRWVEWLPQRIKGELLNRGGGIIWWRVKPEIDHAKIGCDPDVDPLLWTEEEKERGKKHFCWKGYARLATSPALPEDLITQLTDRYEEFRAKARKLREQALAIEAA